jgi:hypothetical protein
MKAKLRKIIIENCYYLYSVSSSYDGKMGINTLTVRIFQNGHKTTPLIVQFLTVDDPILGQPLKIGYSLTNHEAHKTDWININEPKYIRQLILLGIKSGWTGTNQIEVQNGLAYLGELGYDTSSLVPKKIE